MIASSAKNKSFTVETATQWQLIRKQFRKHRLALAAMHILVVLYVLAIFAEFFAPYPSQWKDVRYAYCPTQPLRLSLTEGLHAERFSQQANPVTFQKSYVKVQDDPLPLAFFAKGEPYKLWGLIEWDRHFLGVDRQAYLARHGAQSDSSEPASIPPFYLLGADKYGRDILSRILYGARISLSIGLLAVLSAGRAALESQSRAVHLAIAGGLAHLIPKLKEHFRGE